MAPQTEIPIAANVLGTLGTVFGAFRIYVNWRDKKTDGLPGSMMILWAICGVPFGTYSIVQNFNIPLQLQAQIFSCFSLVTWTQILIYHDKWPTRKATLLATLVGLFFGGIEVALVLTLRPLYLREISYPMVIVGIIASIFLAAGLLPPYYEIWKRRGRVVGINWIFLTIDWLGAFFSLMALVAQNTFDVLGGVLYVICLFLEAAIFGFHLIWLFRTRKIRRDAKAEGRTFDEILEQHARENTTFKFAERRFRSFKKDIELGHQSKSEDDRHVTVEAELGIPTR